MDKNDLLEITTGLASELDTLSRELLKWNRVHNLSGHKDLAGIRIDMIEDALHMTPHIKGGTLLDIGSGAGFPGLVLALARPELKVSLLEPRAKRISFQRHAVRALGLGSRVESLKARTGDACLMGRYFDTVTMRAVSGLEESLTLARPYLAPGGRIILPRAIGDKKAAQRLGLKVITYKLPSPYGRRILVSGS